MDPEHPDTPVGCGALPDWPRGTPLILATEGDGPSAIPVAAALRDGDGALLFALARRREALARLRASPRVALCVLAAGNLAFTAHGEAAVIADPLPGAEGVAAVRVLVDRIQDHTTTRFVVDEGVRWHYVDDEASARNDEVLAALARLLGRS